MVFEQKTFDICGYSFTQDQLEAMTRFPSFYEPFLRLDRSAPKEHRNKCLGERVAMPDGDYTITEKIDGTNCQLIGWSGSETNLVIRSRNELLAYSKGWLWNNKDEMISVLKPKIAQLSDYMSSQFPDTLWVACMELYGPGIIPKKGNKYGPKKDIRLFASRIFYEPPLKLFHESPRESYQRLRRINEYVPYLAWEDVTKIALASGIKTSPMFGTLKGEEFTRPQDAMELLQSHFVSQTAQEDGGSIQSEGVVLWSQKDYVHPKQGKTLAVYKIKCKDYPYI